MSEFVLFSVESVKDVLDFVELELADKDSLDFTDDVVFELLVECWSLVVFDEVELSVKISEFMAISSRFPAATLL